MTATYKKGEIIWAKVQGYSWWPARITKIKLKLCISKNRLGKYILNYEKEPYFYISFFPNDSISKVKLRSIKKFIDYYKLRNKVKYRKKLSRAISIATKAFLDENPDISMEMKRNLFGIKLFSKKKFTLLRKFRYLEEEEEEQNGENDIQSFIDSEMSECENYKNKLKEKKIYIGNKRKKSKDEEISKNVDSESEESCDNIDNKEMNINKKYNKELKKLSNELYKITVEIKRKNTINNIISLFNNIENIIKINDIEYNFNIIKDLLFIVNNYTNHNNETIMNKSISLHKDLICKYLDNLFMYNKEFLEKEALFNESIIKHEGYKNNNYIDKLEQMGNEIIFQINNLKNNNDKCLNLKEEGNINNKENLINKDLLTHSDNNNKLKKKENNNYTTLSEINNNKTKNIYSLNQEIDDEITINNNKVNDTKEKNINIINSNLDNIISDDEGNNDPLNNNEPFLKDIINNPNYFNKKPEGQLYPDNFFKEIYLKVGITPRSELLRKKMCLQLYSVLKLVMPFCQEDIFKKNVIFMEYLARKIDPLFGNKYMIIINMIYNRIKNEAVKIKNKN